MTRLREDGRPWSPRWDAWTPEQDLWLEQRAGSSPVEELAAGISATFGVPRNAHALRIRAKRLGISLWVRGWSMTDVMRLFGMDHRVIKRWWISPGLLTGRRWSGRGSNAGWWFEEANVETFVRDSPWAYDVARMQPGHRLTQLAHVIHRADPWLTYPELMQELGLTEFPVDRWRRRGLIECRRRFGAGGKGALVVRARNVADIQERIEQARSANYHDAAVRGAAKRPQNKPGFVFRRPTRPSFGSPTWRRHCACGALIVWRKLDPAPALCAFCGRGLELTARRRFTLEQARAA